MKKGFVGNIEKMTLANANFREVLYTAEHAQLVLMSLLPGEEIGNEVHTVDQFFRFEKGEGKLVLNNSEEHPVSDGFAVIVPAGTWHNVINTSSKKPLKLYTLYCPPHHLDKVIHKTKQEGESDTADEFKGVTTE